MQKLHSAMFKPSVTHNHIFYTFLLKGSKLDYIIYTELPFSHPFYLTP